MDIDHLSNCYHMLRRRADDVLFNNAVEYVLNTEMRRKVGGKQALVATARHMGRAAAAYADDLKSYIEYRVTGKENK